MATAKCHKQRFKSKSAAMRRARYLRKYGDRRWRGISAYPCLVCGRWHLGHMLGMHALDTYGWMDPHSVTGSVLRYAYDDEPTYGRQR